ncbi:MULTISPECIES: Hsp20/alpha crystallin family protein [unclassified Halorhabdus]|uniref:Hsp20/alpha crystallin family protein n=1 Tax=unclassified Halorhabdus TaxID=2621901 RepID=UPI0023DB9CFD|nr:MULTISPECIES: Hsp20/alpha crystallin family protein [unclassified Halorhabdus]WEL18176.1 Molecular chaperone (HSP20 family) [Halorhabdus sp. SVX81]WEL22054.1 Molecular chaperone (HSP20 family) [Halorhabdus sp. BNX81]
MRRDDRDDPFDDFFAELERMMNDMMSGEFDMHVERRDPDAPAQSNAIHFDVYEEGDRLRVVADLPGVSKDAIDLKCDGEQLTIDAAGTQREYHDRVDLPTRVDEHTADASYNNGILEVSFETSGDSADIDLS